MRSSRGRNPGARHRLRTPRSAHSSGPHAWRPRWLGPLPAAIRMRLEAWSSGCWPQRSRARWPEAIAAAPGEWPDSCTAACNASGVRLCGRWTASHRLPVRRHPGDVPDRAGGELFDRRHRPRAGRSPSGGGRMVYRTAGLPPLASRHDLAALLVVQVRRRPGECPKGHGAGYTASAARQHHILPPPARKVALIVSRLAMTASRTATARSSCPASRLSTVSRPRSRPASGEADAGQCHYLSGSVRMW